MRVENEECRVELQEKREEEEEGDRVGVEWRVKVSWSYLGERVGV